VPQRRYTWRYHVQTAAKISTERDSKVFKKYWQRRLQMKREALQKSIEGERRPDLL